MAWRENKITGGQQHTPIEAANIIEPYVSALTTMFHQMMTKYITRSFQQQHATLDEVVSAASVLRPLLNPYASSRFPHTNQKVSYTPISLLLQSP